jgi:hypothetical protein
MSDDEKKQGGAAARRKKGKRLAPPQTRTGELWAKCPECRMPVKDAELFKHLLNCPGADAKQAEWKAQQEAAKLEPKPDPQPQPEAEAQ